MRPELTTAVAVDNSASIQPARSLFISWGKTVQISGATSISDLLTKSGARSAHGAFLGAEHVFSIYKKGKLRQERLTLKVEPELLDLWVE